MIETCQIQPIMLVLTISILLGILIGIIIYYHAKIDKLKNKIKEQELELYT